MSVPVTTPPVLAADVGGTQMRAALVGPQGDILLRRSAHTPEHADVPAALIDLIAAVGATTDYGAASHAVVGLPGSVDYEVGRLLWAPHLPEGWPEQLLRDELTARLGLPAHIANDADLAAVEEAAFGAGAGSTDVAYLTVSTGIGAGVVYGGRLLRGTRSLAEVGHTVIEWRAWREGLPCTLEELGSGSGVARMAPRPASPHPRRPGGRGGGGRRRRQGDRHLAERHRRLRRRPGEPRHVLLPEHRRHRRRARPAAEFFSAVRELVLRRPEYHPANLSIVPAAWGRRRPDPRGGLGRRERSGLSSTVSARHPLSRPCPAKGSCPL